MADRLNSPGRYIYGSDPNLPLERTADPVDWFHVALRVLMIAATAGVVAYIFASSDATPPASATSPAAIEVGMGREVQP